MNWTQRISYESQFIYLKCILFFSDICDVFLHAFFIISHFSLIRNSKPHFHCETSFTERNWIFDDVILAIKCYFLCIKLNLCVTSISSEIIEHQESKVEINFTDEFNIFYAFMISSCHHLNFLCFVLIRTENSTVPFLPVPLIIIPNSFSYPHFNISLLHDSFLKLNGQQLDECLGYPILWRTSCVTNHITLYTYTILSRISVPFHTFSSFVNNWT